MNKITSTITLLFLIQVNIFAQQNATRILKLNDSPSYFNVLSSTSEQLIIENNISNIKYQQVETLEGHFIEFLGQATTNTIGVPELPVQKKLIQIPIGAKIEITLLNYTEHEALLSDKGIDVSIKPHQASVAKSQDQNKVPFILDKDAYNIDSYGNSDIISVEILGMQRGMQIARLNIAPIRYNPITNSIKHYSNIKAELNFIGGKAETINHQQYITNSFIANPNAFSKATETQAVKYIILSHPMFKDSLQSFIQWKTRKGFEVIEVYPGEDGVGTSKEEIKTYLQNIYESATPENPAPLYGLIVGDVAQIPSFDGNTGDHVTDLHYFEYTGDYFPELYYGRFSANNTDELMPQLNKTMEYEMYTMANPSFLDEVTLVAGVDQAWGPGFANAHVNYGFEYYFNEEHGFTSHTYLHPRSGTLADEIINTVSEGVGLLKYSGHCLSSGWLNPAFSTNNIFELSNDGKYPTVFGNCCESLRFEAYASFGEVWLRAEDKGAIGYIGASNLSYWVEDYYFDIGFGDGGSNPSYEGTTNAAMDLMFHENDEAFETWATTNGQIVQAGNLSVTQAGTDRVNYYWEVYHLMGDPSLMTYLATPKKLNVKHDENIFIGNNKTTVEVETGAYVALSINNELIDTEFANEDGIAVLELPFLENECIIDLVITKQNYEPFMSTINGIKQNNAELIYISHIANDSEGNNNGTIDFGEMIKLNLEASNIGFEKANNVEFILSSESDIIEITENNFKTEAFDARTTNVFEDIFSFNVTNNIEGSNPIQFTIKAKDDLGQEWLFNFETIAYGPVFILSQVTLDDDLGGNHNLSFDGGEIITLSYTLSNSGKADSKAMNSELQCLTKGVEVLQSKHTIPNIVSDSSVNGQFMLAVDPNIDVDHNLELKFIFTNESHTYESTQQYSINKPSEQFESGDLNLYNWNTSSLNAWQPFESNDEEMTYAGKWGLKSAKIEHEDTSVIDLLIETILADSVSFYKKVSSQDTSFEGTYRDYLEFFIDGESHGKWSGEMDWSYEAFPLSIGMHTLTWKYIKDKYTDTGSDCAWIDQVTFPKDKSISENNHPEISSEPDTLIHVADAYKYSIETKVNDGNETFIKTVVMPDWLSFVDNKNGTAELTGKPEQIHSGIHPVIISVFDGLASNYQIYNINVKNKTSIANQQNNTNLMIYPNPSSGLVHIEYTDSENEIINIEIFDALGKSILSTIIGQYKTTLDLNTFNSGIYYIKVNGDNYSTTKKLFLSN